MSIKKRLKHITHIPKEYLRVDPPVPKSVKIELTPRCNYKCQYCAYTLRKNQPTTDMDWALFEAITTELSTIGVEEIGVFYIGEPFMSPHLLISAIEFLKHTLKIPYVFVTSNASLAAPEYVEACMEAGLDSLKWSCNAANVEQFAQLMGVSTRMFEFAKENIKHAYTIRQDNNYTTKLYASSVLYDPDQRKRMSSLLYNNILPYVDDHYWLPLYTAGGQVRDKEKKLGMQPTAGNTGRLDDPAEPIPCWTLFTSSHILYDGRMTACCLDGTGNWVVGDLNKNSFMQCWHSKAFKDLRRAHLKKDIRRTKCAKCVMAPKE